MSQQPERPGPGSPPPIQPDSVLDSVLSTGGPLPTAGLGLRALALLLDCILMAAVASVIIWKVVLAQTHPGAFAEMMQWTQEVVAWLQNRAADTSMPEPSRELREALGVAYEIQLLLFWLYFAIGEAFFAGSSLGKRICRIRTISTVTLAPPPILAGMIRGALKTLTLFWLFPVFFAATFLALWFNKRRQLAHDLCARTVVVDEKYIDTASQL